MILQEPNPKECLQWFQEGVFSGPWDVTQYRNEKATRFP